MRENGALLFVGDVFLPHPVNARFDLPGELVVNLEGPITRRGKPAPGKVNLRMEESHLCESFGRTPLAACLANNHVLDYGDEGLFDTIMALEAGGTHWFGAGCEKDNYGNPLLVSVGDVSVALVGYSNAVGTSYAQGGRLGAAPLEVPRIVRDMSLARERGATSVVVCLHWGAENVYLPRPADVGVGRELLAAGADLVIGHHAHRVQPFERVGDRYIFYGLGNCIFPDFDAPAFYDNSGRPTTHRRTRWNPWNLRSLAVAYVPTTGDVQVHRLAFRHNRLSLVQRGRRPLPTHLCGVARYEKLYKASYLGGKLKAKLVRWLRHPHLPRSFNPAPRLALWRRNLWRH